MPDTEVLEFKLEIGPGSQGKYPVAVLESSSGQAKETMRLPLSDLTFDNLFEEMQAALLPASTLPSEKEQAVQELGRWLYETTFTGKVRTLYVADWQQARQQNKPLRLTLSVKPTELTTLPWEYLYAPEEQDYLCLTNASLVRYLEQPEARKLTSATPPLRILGLIVGPQDQNQGVAEAKKRLESTVQDLQTQDLVEVVWVEGQSWDDLQRSLRLGDWHVIYLSAVVGYDQDGSEGSVDLADQNGSSQPISIANLSSLLTLHQSLRLVVLGTPNSPNKPSPHISTAAADLVRRGVPAALAVKYQISNQAETTFYRAFFKALVTKPVDLAVAEARAAVHSRLARSLEWGAPILYTNTPDLILLDRETLAATACQRGDEAMDRDDFDRAITQYSLAIEMGGGTTAQEKKTLAEDVDLALSKARTTLRTPSDHVEAQADAVITHLADLQRLGRRLPESQAIQIELTRVQKTGLTLRNQLWEDARQLMQAKTVGLTLDQRQRRMEDSVRMLEKATMLDQEDSPGLKQDLARAMRRLNYLQASQTQAKAERGRRWRVYALVGTAIVIVLALICFGLQQIPFSSLVTHNTPTAELTSGTTSEPVVVQVATTTLPTVQVAQPTAVPSEIPTLANTAEPTTRQTEPATSTAEPDNPPTPTTDTSAVPTQEPSTTLLPTATEFPSATPTIPPTETPTTEPEPSLPAPTPTPTATPPPTETPTPGIVYPAPRLLEPEDISLLSQTTYSTYPLKWEWNGVLQENEWFDVRVWQEGTPHYGVAWTKAQEYIYDLCLQGSGTFLWSIAVIRGEAGQWLGDLSPEAAPHQFTSARSDTWCRRHDRFSLPPRAEP